MLHIATSALALTSVLGATQRWTEHEDCGSETQTCWAWEYCPEGYSVTWQQWSWECFSRIDGCKYEDCVAPGGCRVDLYEDHDAQGLKSVKFTPGSYNLVGGADIVSSVRLTGNNCKLEVFEFASGQGRSLVMDQPKLYNMKGGMDNAVKSMRLTVRASVDRRLDNLDLDSRRLDESPMLKKIAKAALEEAAAKMEMGETVDQAIGEIKDEWKMKWTDVMAYPDLSNGMLEKSESQDSGESDDMPAPEDDAMAKALAELAAAVAKGEAKPPAKVEKVAATSEKDLYKQAFEQLTAAMEKKMAMKEKANSAGTAEEGSDDFKEMMKPALQQLADMVDSPLFNRN